MILACPALVSLALTSAGPLDRQIAVFHHHPGIIDTQERMAARDRDAEIIFEALKKAKIGYRYGGGLGSGYRLKIRIGDLPAWQAVVSKLHKDRALAYYTEWRKDRDGYGLLPLHGGK